LNTYAKNLNSHLSYGFQKATAHLRYKLGLLL
jgi:hypothetical protein